MLKDTREFIGFRRGPVSEEQYLITSVSLGSAKPGRNNRHKWHSAGSANWTLAIIWEIQERHRVTRSWGGDSNLQVSQEEAPEPMKLYLLLGPPLKLQALRASWLHIAHLGLSGIIKMSPHAFPAGEPRNQHSSPGSRSLTLKVWFVDELCQHHQSLLTSHSQPMFLVR